jgi:hypothetical protein
LIESCIVTTRYTDQINDQYQIRVENYLQAGLFDNQLLFTRGWAIQERILPYRVLHFGERQVFWESRREEASETYPSGIPLERYSGEESFFRRKDNWKRYMQVKHKISAEELKSYFEFIYGLDQEVDEI